MTKEFKVGDEIVIQRSPSCWASELSYKNPMDRGIKYPMTVVVEELYDDGIYIAMKAGGYGFSLSNLIENNNIKLVNRVEVLGEVKKRDFKVRDKVDPEESFWGHSAVDELYKKWKNWIVGGTEQTRREQLPRWVIDEIADYKPVKKTIMNTVTTMMKKMLDGDTQALVKAGYVNGGLELTPEGKIALVEILFTEYKTELVASAKEVIKEAEKNK